MRLREKIRYEIPSGSTIELLHSSEEYHLLPVSGRFVEKTDLSNMESDCDWIYLYIYVNGVKYKPEDLQALGYSETADQIYEICGELLEEE